jgi:spermidine synthase
LLTRAGLALAPEFELYITGQGFAGSNVMVTRYALALLAMFPSALLLGATLALSFFQCCGTLDLASNRMGRGYAAATLAGVAGAAMAGLWLIPCYGTDRLLLVASLTVAASALAFMVVIRKAGTRAILSLLVLMTALMGVFFPGLDYPNLIRHLDKHHRSSFYVRTAAEPELLFLKEGNSGVISVMDYGGVVMLKNNAFSESQLPIKRARSEMLLGLMPTLFKPDAKSAFVVGYGAGTTARMLAATGLKSIRTVESEPAIVEAMATIEDGGIAPQDGQHLKIDHNDARNALLLDSARYDIIVSQSPYPWRSGALFSSEFFKIAHSRLNKGGVFAQWVNLYKLDATTLRALLRTFYAEFPRGVVFNNNLATEIMLFGTDDGLELEHDHVANRIASPELSPFIQALAIGKPNDLVEKYFLFTRDVALTMAGEAPVITDLNLFSEARLAGMRERPEKPEDPRVLKEP